MILTGAQATKINFSDHKNNNNIVATGVTYQVNGTSYTVNAGKEVILSAGAFQSPQYVMLDFIFATITDKVLLIKVTRVERYRKLYNPSSCWRFDTRMSSTSFIFLMAKAFIPG